MFVGIDPGKKGAIAIMTEEPTIFKMPQEENREDLVSILKNIKDIGAKVIIEKQITKQMIGKMPCPKCKALIPYRYPQKGVHTSLMFLLLGQFPVQSLCLLRLFPLWLFSLLNRVSSPQTCFPATIAQSVPQFVF